MICKTPRLRRMMATALPTGIHSAFISVPFRQGPRSDRPLAKCQPQPPALGVPYGNRAEMLSLLMPPPGVRAGIVPEVTQNARGVSRRGYPPLEEASATT